MSLSPAFLDELRARTLLSAVISPSVKLIRAGREWKACCPFHKEKTPSFTINDEKGFYHCFGCGAHGDAIRFLTDARGLPFMDAVKELASKAGLDVPAPDPQARERAERTSTLTDVMAACQKWFAEQLAGIDGAEAREYLKKRGIGPATVARFGIGLAPEGRNKLKTALSSLGEDKLVETGMLINPDEGETYDRFRGRLMIPIRDARGRVIAFGGRILGQGEPKYLNSPDTPLFDKGRTLYNLDLASPATRSARRLIVVEGYMDVIALDRAGIAEAVAPNGTAVTEAQLERMWRLDPNPILCFDGDSAGQKAAIRAAMRALPLLGAERTLRFVELPAGQDPDDVVRNGGRDAVEALLSRARAARRPPLASRAAGPAPHHPRSPRRPPPAPDRAFAGHRRPGARPPLPRRLAPALQTSSSARQRDFSAARSAGNGRSKAADSCRRRSAPATSCAGSARAASASSTPAPSSSASPIFRRRWSEHCEQLALLPDRRSAPRPHPRQAGRCGRFGRNA